MPEQIFSKFPELPAGLQVAIVEHALNNIMETRQHKLTIRYNIQGSFSNRSVQLPYLPAIYHVNRFFRAEAMRIRPAQQLFEQEREDQRGYLVVFDASCDTFEVILRGEGDWESA
jgi:hypothetical protein